MESIFRSATGIRTQDPLVTVPSLFRKRLDYVITHAVPGNRSLLEHEGAKRFPSQVLIGKVLPKGIVSEPFYISDVQHTLIKDVDLAARYHRENSQRLHAIHFVGTPALLPGAAICCLTASCSTAELSPNTYGKFEISIAYILSFVNLCVSTV
jgi:hypothetical protein